MQNGDTLIEVKDLHKSFGKHEVLKGMNMTVKKGEVIAIIGPSGCGKSTFLRSLNLLEEPTSGVVTFEGVDITDESVDINEMREKMGMVFQQFNLFPNMTIKEIFEHSQNVDGWILGIDGYASKVDLGNPAILAGIGKYRVKTIYPDVHDGKVVVELDVETSIVTD